ncbi:hypothetical protein L210DRAFT_3530953, partial [Boletus edulis BED1]
MFLALSLLYIVDISSLGSRFACMSFFGSFPSRSQLSARDNPRKTFVTTVSGGCTRIFLLCFIACTSVIVPKAK